MRQAPDTEDENEAGYRQVLMNLKHAQISAGQIGDKATATLIEMLQRLCLTRAGINTEPHTSTISSEHGQAPVASLSIHLFGTFQAFLDGTPVNGWRKKNGQPGDTIILPLDGRNFSGSAWAGSAPAGATQAEIRLIQPKGANNITNNLLVESVVLEKIDLVPVPLVFLSEAPGLLTVSQMHDAYDIPEAPKPSRRTSIAASNGGGTKTTVAQMVVAADSKAGGMVMPTPQLQPQPTPIPETGTTADATQVPPTPQPSQAPAASTSSLTSIPGIGEARANQLQAVGIDSLEKLATAAPEDIVQTLKGVTLEMATGFTKEAQQLIAPPSPGTTSS